MSFSYDELRSWSDEELIAGFDHHAKNTYINSVNFFLEEMTRRRAERQGEIMIEQGVRMERMTRWIMWFTVVVTIATVLNFIIFLMQ